MLAATPTSTCCSIRNYNYVVESASPDVVRMTDSSICSPAAKSHLKSAIGVVTRSLSPG